MALSFAPFPAMIRPPQEISNAFQRAIVAKELEAQEARYRHQKTEQESQRKHAAEIFLEQAKPLIELPNNRPRTSVFEIMRRCAAIFNEPIPSGNPPAIKRMLLVSDGIDNQAIVAPPTKTSFDGVKIYFVNGMGERGKIDGIVLPEQVLFFENVTPAIDYLASELASGHVENK